MNRGDKLEDQIRAVLAAEASTRRLVAVRARPPRSARLVRSALAVGVATFLIVGALALGSSLRALRGSPVASQPQPEQSQAARAQPLGVCAAAQARVIGLSGIVTRLDRIAVKRMTLQDLSTVRDAGAAGIGGASSAISSNTVLCVVAVGGEIRQSFGVQDAGPFSWAVFVSVAGGDDPIVSSSMGSSGNWPLYFDALPDRQGNPYPGTVTDVVGPQTLKVRLESPMLSAEFGNPVLVEASSYTLIQPGAATIAATGVAPGDRVAIFFEREGRNAASGAYPLSIFQLTEAALRTATQAPRTSPISTTEIVALLTSAGIPSRISPPARARALLYNATDLDLIGLDEPAIKGFVVYRYSSVAAAAAAFRLEAVQDPRRSTITYRAKPYFVGLGDTLVNFVTDDEAVARRLIAALLADPASAPKCPPGELPILDITQPAPPGDAPGTGSGTAEAAFRKANPSARTFTMYPFGSDQPTTDPNALGRGPVWIVAGNQRYIAVAPGAPGPNNWFAYPVRFLGCRAPSTAASGSPPRQAP